MHDPRAIANEFIKLGRKNNSPLTLMQILKLSYIAHGFSLAFLDRPLSNSGPEAWGYGPVFPEVYHSLKFHGDQPVTEVIAKIEINNENLLSPIEEKFSSEESQVIDFVYNNYGQLSGHELSELTHKEGTPWKNAWNGGYGQWGITISNLEIKKHFKMLFE